MATYSSEDLNERGDIKKKNMSSSSGEEDNDDIQQQQQQNNQIQNKQQKSKRYYNRSTSNSSARNYRITKSKKSNVWEVIEGYRDVNMKVSKPENYEGYLLKRRNWPMKGWHKRYFILADGILTYGKSKPDILKGKIHGTLNVYLSIVSYITSSRRILIDSSTQSSALVCHLKTKIQNDFNLWLEHIKQHRLYNQYIYSQPNTMPKLDDIDNKGNIRMDQIDSIKANAKMQDDVLDDDLTIETNFKNVEKNLCNLSKVLKTIHTNNNQAINTKFTVSVKRLVKENINMFKTNELLNVNSKANMSRSNPNLYNEMIHGVKQNTAAELNEDDELKLNYYEKAKYIYDQLACIYQQLAVKSEKLMVLANNKTDQMILNQAKTQARRSQSILSSVSLQDSQLQFYDAIEWFSSDSESDEESADENYSDVDASTDNTSISNKKNYQSAVISDELLAQTLLARRRALPAVAPDTSQISLWSILRKAIGKDLSKISLPVVLNEPLSILQRLCEELEYSDLLDAANNCADPNDRMIYIAAFIISGYSSSYYRNGCKDFNPLLGETYELVRPDKGWKYISEQVSHHPPVSACHCQSKSFIFEQVFHAKVKFWGKSMEVHPEGYTRLTLPKYNETYQWNKIVMYVYNVMGTPRRIEHCGEITIRCTSGVSCTITFPKSNYSNQKNEFFGDIIEDNIVKRKIFGQWHESFVSGMDSTAKTIWRMGAMPEDAHLYYGFTRFAIELNELTDNLKDILPPTDSRFRPDQRHLEEGRVDKAESEKQRIEEMQRSRRRLMDTNKEQHKPLWFNPCVDSDDWESNNQYWIKRDNPGFKNIKEQFLKLW